MDVRERLRDATPGGPARDDRARALYQRGRRRVARRRALGAGGASALVVVAAVAFWPTADTSTPPPFIEEGDTDPAPDLIPADDGGTRIQVGDVVLTVPDGAVLDERGSGPLPCLDGIEVPTLVVLEALEPQPSECPTGDAEATVIAAAAASTVPPASLPGHADVDDSVDVTTFTLLGRDGTSASEPTHDGTDRDTLYVADLDLHLEVLGPDLTPDFLDDLLATAELAEEGAGGPDGDTAPGDDPGDPTSPVDDPASTDDRESPPAGPSDLELVDVRVGTHDGFDRVTLEFTGDGEVGWFAGLRPEALEDASGRPRDVAGDHVLEVFANMLAFPPDLDDPTDWNQVTVDAPADAGVVTEVVGSIWFEGQQQVFIGLREPVPYRMVRLDDPQRIVIDLQHP